VLCLTIFGLLSFTTAFADKKLADRTLNNMQEYYTADTQAEQTLADIYTQVYNKMDGEFLANQSFADFVRSAVDLPDIEIRGIDEFESTEVVAAVVSYQTQMNDVQALSSEVMLLCNIFTGEFAYKISKWNIILTADFDYGGQGLDVWDGGEFIIFE
jgi:hypothetical protein